VALGRLLPLLLALAALVGCGHATSRLPRIDRGTAVEVGTVTPQGAVATQQALAHAGIPSYMDGSLYPQPYRIFVPPAHRERAVGVLRELGQNSLNAGYEITHEPQSKKR
jgi:hypothetical protein